MALMFGKLTPLRLMHGEQRDQIHVSASPVPVPTPVSGRCTAEGVFLAQGTSQFLENLWLAVVTDALVRVDRALADTKEARQSIKPCGSHK